MPLKMVLKVSEIWGFPTCGPLCLGWMNFNRLLGWIHIRLQGWINNRLLDWIHIRLWELDSQQ